MNSAFLKINTCYDSDSDSSLSSEYITPRKTFLRIETGMKLRTNTPSPPTIERRSPPIKKIKSMPVFYSPKPDSVLKLIQTPNNLQKKNIVLKKNIERDVKETIENLINTIEEKEYIHKMIHKSSNNLCNR